MGTSQSNKGPASNIALVPPWTPDPLKPKVEQSDNAKENPKLDYQNDISQLIAPKARFSSARGNISRFAKTGEAKYLKNGFSQYAKKGLGGAKAAAKRLGGTSIAAGRLYNILISNLNELQIDKFDLNQLKDKPVKEIIIVIIEAVSSTDGAQDTEARQKSVSNSLSQLLLAEPNADLCSLTEEQIEITIVNFVIEDVLRRFELDLWQSIIANAPSISESSKRIKNAQAYIREVIKKAFRSLKESGKKISRKNVKIIVNKAIENAFYVFGE